MLTETAMIRVGKDDVIHSSLARPMGAGPFPGVVLLHHMPGWDDWMPTPVVQFKVLSQGCVIAVGDFGWEEFNTVGEFDGAEKYGRLLIPGERAGDKVFQEKMREDRIRDTGLVVVRWTWDELNHPRDLAARIRRALQRGFALTQTHAAPQK